MHLALYFLTLRGDSLLSVKRRVESLCNLIEMTSDMNKGKYRGFHVHKGLEAVYSNHDDVA